MSSSKHTETIRPARNLSGMLRLPGDKSISHRYAMLAGLARGVTTLTNYSTGADCASTLGCIAALGAQVNRTADSIEITGTAGTFSAPAAPLDCGNSGSTMRMLSGLICPHPHTFTLIGDESLSRRPMERIRAPLSQMGARIALTDGHAPLTIHGQPLIAIAFDAPIASAQVKTAVLFAGLQARGITTLSEKIRTRDHGEHALRAFGAQLTRTPEGISITGGQKLHAITASVPGDISSAAFYLAAALLFPDSQLTLENLGMNPTRAALFDVLAGLGGQVQILNLEEQFGELVGTVSIRGPVNGLSGAEISGAVAAQLIDELPVLAAIAPFTREGIRIRDARELRVKESDRIALTARGLRAMGATVTEHDDGLDVPGNQTLHGAQIDSGGDHRIAMAFSVAALRASGDTLIRGADAAQISFPEFYTLLNRIAER